METPPSHRFRFDDYFRDSPVAMAVVNGKGQILLGNHALADLFRLPLSVLEGDFLNRYFPEFKTGNALAGLLTSTGGRRYQETEGRGGEGARLPLLLSVIPEMGDAKASLVVLENLTERQSIQRRLDAVLYFDALTGLANRRLLENRLEQAILRAERGEKRLTVLTLGLHRFNMVNQSFDRSAGNFLLREAGDRMAQLLRKTDTLARYQGDEFAVVLEGISAREPVLRILDTLLRALEEPFAWEGQEIFLSAQAGIAVYPEDGPTGEILLTNAETALHGAKEQSRKFLFYARHMDARARERLRLESELIRAVEREEFTIFFQPQIDTQGGTVCGVEALLRWQHPQRGFISPLEFIPILEDNGRIIKVDRWVLRQACSQVRQWQQESLPGLQLSVNLSAQQFQDPAFVPFLGQVLAETGLEPEDLVLEITESLLMRDTEESAAILASFAQIGVKIAIDDFGTGFSSLAYLKKFPVTTVKIDRGFVEGIPHSRHDVAIGSAILSLADNLGLGVVAEGVERREQLDSLRALNCRHMQGFLFSRPMPPETFGHWLREELPELRQQLFPPA